MTREELITKTTEFIDAFPWGEKSEPERIKAFVDGILTNFVPRGEVKELLNKINGCIAEEINPANCSSEDMYRISKMWEEAMNAIAAALKELQSNPSTEVKP